VATGGTRFEAVQRGNDALVHRVILTLVRKMTSPVLSNAERLNPIIIKDSRFHIETRVLLHHKRSFICKIETDTK
jgi:hypothetical protein